MVFHECKTSPDLHHCKSMAVHLLSEFSEPNKAVEATPLRSAPHLGRSTTK
jgi:hypothetical protein